MARILHTLSQRPMLTGSGVTLDAIARHADGAGYAQCVSVGVPASDPLPDVGGLPADAIRPLQFGHGGIAAGSSPRALAFPVPGMSDVMPYPSTRFSAMTSDQLADYRAAWRSHIGDLVAAFKPDVIHSHHIWLLSALLKDIAPDVPVVTHCHATGLRQMILCPHLADEVRRGCGRNDRFVVLHDEHRAKLAQALDVGDDRITVVGAGYREGVFHCQARPARDPDSPLRLAYAGKFSHAKGLPWLLDAIETLDVVLHVAGGGAGDEAEALHRRMQAMHPRVALHGQLDQPALADMLRTTDVFVLPSFYEGLPLVLAEALACGNRVIATRLSGIEAEIAPSFGPMLTLVDLPRLRDVDQPIEADLPQFVTSLRDAIERSRSAESVTADPGRLQTALAPFTWRAVFGRIDAVWRALL